MKRTDASYMRHLGCAQARAIRSRRQPEHLIVILAFGKPARGYGHLGTILLSGHFRPMRSLLWAAEGYARGFSTCARHLPDADLLLGLGTSNWGNQVSFAHGRAWGAMVEAANRWARRAGVASRVMFNGAADIEPGFGGPKHARAWVNGYASATTWRYLDFGSLDGCPPAGRCLGRWTLEDAWYVAWGAAPAWPLPEIYASNGINADQWFRLGMYSIRRHHTQMRFAGVMTQRGACAQVHDPCRGINNRPQQAWAQLTNRLNTDPRTAQEIAWATDILW